jgi:hypothetical protein
MLQRNKVVGAAMDGDDISRAAMALARMSEAEMDEVMRDLSFEDAPDMRPFMPERVSTAEDDFGVVPGGDSFYSGSSGDAGFRDLPHLPSPVPTLEGSDLGFFTTETIDDSALATGRHEILSFFWGTLVAPMGFRRMYPGIFNSFEASMITLADNYRGFTPFVRNPDVLRVLMNVRNPNARNGTPEHFAEHMERAIEDADDLNAIFIAGHEPGYDRMMPATLPPMRRDLQA